MRILIADIFSLKALDELRSFGHEVIYNPDLNDSTLTQTLNESKAHILVVRSTKVTAPMLRTSDSLQLIVRAGAGVNTIDVKTASQLGIFVANCPGKNAVAVAELVFGLLLSIDRKIPDNVISMRESKWNKQEYSKGSGLKGRILGLLGFGAIGQEVAIRAHPFEMDVLVWSRSLTNEVADDHRVTRVATPLEVARRSDIISVHVAATKDTTGLCGVEFFSAMNDGAIFINTSRGEVVDENALIHAINSKGIKAGLDVFQNEPTASSTKWACPFAALPNVYTTHHIGASTAQAEEAIGAEALRIIKVFGQSGEVINCVNIDRKSPATHIMTVRHLNRVGVLAAILGQVRQAEINVLEMENLIFEGDDAAMAKIRLSRAPDDHVLAAIKTASSAILSVTLMPVS